MDQANVKHIKQQWKIENLCKLTYLTGIKKTLCFNVIFVYVGTKSNHVIVMMEASF